MALYDSGSGGDIDQAVDRLELEVAQLSGEEQRRRARVAGGVAAVCLACFALMLFWPPGSPPEDLSLRRRSAPRRLLPTAASHSTLAPHAAHRRQESCHPSGCCIAAGTSAG